MTETPTYIVEKLSIDIQCRQKETGETIRRNMSDWLHNRILPEMEKLLHQLDVPGRHLRLETLSLDLGNVSAKHWKHALQEKLLQVLTRQLLEQIPPSTPPGDLLDDYIFFLQHGRMPWWNPAADEGKITALLMRQFEATVLTQRLLSGISGQPQALRRLVYRCDHTFFQHLWTGTSKQHDLPAAFELFKTRLLRHMPQRMADIYAREVLLLHPASAATPKAEVMAVMWETLLNRTDARQRFPALLKNNPAAVPLNSNNTSEQPPHAPLPAGEIWYVNLAGIVLLAPFLQTFIATLGVGAPNEPGEMFRRENAANWLGYLATGSETLPETDMLLPKILCGLPPEHPLPARADTVSGKKEECDKLLHAVASYWTPLQHTSPDGIREGFLLRIGKLEKTPAGLRLTVERKAQDILLDRLPWAFSVIKLPWMQEMLFVEW